MISDHLFTFPKGFKLFIGDSSFHTIPIGAVIAVAPATGLSDTPLLRLWHGETGRIRFTNVSDYHKKGCVDRLNKIAEDFKEEWEEFMALLQALK